jgi:hypothetical protein
MLDQFFYGQLDVAQDRAKKAGTKRLTGMNER